MNKVRLSLAALSLLLTLGFARANPVNSQEVLDENSDCPEFIASQQLSEMPGGDTFAMRMQEGGPRGGMALGASCPYLEGENKLTDEQFEKLYQIKNKLKDDMGSKMLEMSKLRRQFCDELNRESIDTKTVSKLEDRMAFVKGETSKVFTTAALDMMNVLTAEQRKILRQKMVRGSSIGSSMMRHCDAGMGRGPGMMMHPPRRHRGGDK